MEHSVSISNLLDMDEYVRLDLHRNQRLLRMDGWFSVEDLRKILVETENQIKIFKENLK